MENGREVRSTSLKYDDGRKATNSGAVRGSYPPLPRSGLVQQNLSVIRIAGKKRGRVPQERTCAGPDTEPGARSKGETSPSFLPCSRRAAITPDDEWLGF